MKHGVQTSVKFVQVESKGAESRGRGAWCRGHGDMYDDFHNDGPEKSCRN
ncbi:hypothetical protein [Emticicia agri]|nr:hypothetical protein [Emticicia agri]